ncbi:hypothetical protein IPM19_02895 [bacterium]|nr:MAG: hypothetical protein IPM19_02895 [bacterium]
MFKQGKLLTSTRSAEMIIQNALALGSSVVIGMTTEEQITRNIGTLKEKNYEIAI